jgi:hypothetical protein
MKPRCAVKVECSPSLGLQRMTGPCGGRYFSWSPNMKERTSKTLLLIESMLFLLPLSVLTGIYALFLVQMYKSGGLTQEPWQAHAASGFTFLGLALQICAWRVIAAFLHHGRDGIRRVAKLYLYAITAGAALVTISGGVVVLLVLGIELPELAILSPNYLAIPALLPFLHVMLERWSSQRSSISDVIEGKP